MKLLLDTHVVLWWQVDDRRLKDEARKAIATADLVWVSAASGWEISIKRALGRLRLSEPFPLMLRTNDFTELPITLAHTERFASVTSHQPDPFDRMLVAQALVEQATLVSHDRAFEPYGIDVLWT